MPINLRKSLSLQCPNCLEKGKVGKIIDGKFSVYFCNGCHNGFTYPPPKDIGKYYHHYYWTPSSFIGKTKDLIFSIFQRRRIGWVTKRVSKGAILDVGSGESKFGEALPSTYKVVNIEPPASSVKEKSVIKTDFLKWKTSQKFDAICFWESLEHTPSPQLYLSKAYKLLKKGGFIFIEFPRHNSFESRIFGKNWFHLDLPRHLSHLTDKGIINLLTRVEFTNITTKNVPSFDYAPWGFVASLLNSLGINLTDRLKKMGNIAMALLITPLTIVGFSFEMILILINQSPIGLAVAQKK